MREPVRCRATSKSTQERCRRLVKAEGHLCRWHGGANPVVAARQELDAQLGRPSEPLAHVDPREAIAQTVASAKIVVEHLHTRVAAGKVTDEDLEQLRRWLDSLQRFAKTDIDVQASRVGLSEEHGRVLVWVLEQVIADCGLDPTDTTIRAHIHRRLMQSDEWMQGGHKGTPPTNAAPRGDALSGVVIG